jgi:AcrR family transcriptional regulator
MAGKNDSKRLGRPATLEAPHGTILKAATMLFAEKGYSETSLMDIAQAVGLSKAAVYHYFPTKQVIYEAIVVDLLQRLCAHVEGAIAGKPATTADRLRTMMHSHAEFFEGNYAEYVTLLHGVAGLNRAVGDEERSIRDRYEGLYRTVMTEGLRAGDLRIDDPAIAARAVLSMLNWMTRWFDPKGPRRATSFADAYFDIVAHGVLKR